MSTDGPCNVVQEIGDRGPNLLAEAEDPHDRRLEFPIGAGTEIIFIRSNAQGGTAVLAFQPCTRAWTWSVWPGVSGSSDDLAERPVALKVTPETDGEPQLLARLQHTNIVPIHAVYQAGPLQAICMPYFGSITLARVIADLRRNSSALPQTGRGLLSTLFNTRLHGSAPTHVDNVPAQSRAEEPPALTALAKMSQVEAALWIAARLADGLAHAHQRGVLHCDLKPANILVADDGQPMLLDFNVATDRKSAANSKSLRLGGTVPYMVPEYLSLVHNDNGELTPRADLFSLGVVLYELLTGSEPHPMSNEQNTDLMGSYLRTHSKLPEAPANGTRQSRQPSTRLFSNSWSQIRPADTRRRLMFAKIWSYNSQIGRLSMPRILQFVNMRKWHRRNPRLTVGLAVAVAALVFLILPTTALAVRSEQMAAHQHEVARARRSSRIKRQFGN